MRIPASRRLALFRATGSRPPVDPLLAVSVHQALEVRSSADLVPVDDPRGLALAYARWAGGPVPVLDPRRWGGSLGRASEVGRVVLVRGAHRSKVLAIPIADLEIRAFSDDELRRAERRASGAAGWSTPALGVLRVGTAEALVLDVDALFGQVYA